MSLYYDTRIRKAVIKRWSKANITTIDFSRSEIPKDQVDPEDSALLKDMKIPIHFKNLVAQQLYDAEEEEIKQAVQSKRDADLFAMTVYRAKDEQRIELVETYQK